MISVSWAFANIVLFDTGCLMKFRRGFPMERFIF